LKCVFRNSSEVVLMTPTISPPGLAYKAITVLAAVMLGAAVCVGPLASCRAEAARSPLDRAVEEARKVHPQAVAPAGVGHAHGHTARPAADDVREPGAIRSFCESWGLFHNSYLVGWLIGLLLSLVGVIVVARDQVFLGAAVSQASTLGIALALCASGVFPLHSATGALAHSTSWLCCDTSQAVMAIAFSMLAALVTARASRGQRESHEAITGWVFLISASLSVLAVAHSPYGLEEIRRIHSSSIIGATPADVAVFALLLLATALVFAVAGRRLLLVVMDPAMAAAVGLRVQRWAVFESLWLGLVVGLSIRVSGMLFTFGSLVLPPLVAKNVCREVRPMFFVAPLVALVTNTLGFVVANRCDSPPAQMNVAIASVLLLAVWLARKWLRRRAPT